MRRSLVALTLAALTLPPAASAADLPFHGFVEAAAGARVVNDDTTDDDFLLEEARFQVDILADTDAATLQFRADFVHDGVAEDSLVDVREANVALTPLDSLDLKVGRQVLTWGTGDLIFLNDLFPKDWQSFFIGRDDEYLKKPSDAVRGTWFGDWLTVDVAWMPVFEADGYISGERISYWNPLADRRFGPDDPAIDPDEPAKSWGNGTLAARLSGSVGQWETELYGFRGHWGQPKGFDQDRGTAYFPRLEAWGASARGSVLGGVANAEFSWYRSLDDLDGDDPTVPNSQVRALAGFGHELARDQTLSVQAYLERTLDFPDVGFTDQNRWWLTARYTGLFLQQNLTLSLFGFYSPTEDDAYLRPVASYKVSDEVLVTVGGNLFLGAHDDTFFGQFSDNTNMYGRVRYSF